MAILNVIDVSHWNDKSKVRFSEAKCLICKATEGSGFRDTTMMSWVKEAIYCDMGIGLYHYARPELNDIYAEVDNFSHALYEVWDSYPEAHILPVLDFEGKAHSAGGSAWAESFCCAFENKFGKYPVFYTSQSMVKKYANLCAMDVGLWMAHYTDGNKRGSFSPWTVLAMWQYTSTPYDKSYFYGNETQWDKYTIRDPRLHEKESDCPTCCACDCCEKCPINGKH